MSTRFAYRALVVLLVVPGAMLHMAAHLVPALWPVNNRMVEFLHTSWWKR